MVTSRSITRTTTPTRGIALVEVLVATLILGVALSVLVGLAGRALWAQASGERLETAAMLLDEQLNLVLARGPDSYASRFDTRGRCDEPFEMYTYSLDISGGDGGAPYRVAATVSWEEGGRVRSETVETCMAPRLGDDPDPYRRPDDAVLRY